VDYAAEESVSLTRALAGSADLSRASVLGKIELEFYDSNDREDAAGQSLPHGQPAGRTPPKAINN
jgi:hypothetical protein